MSTIALHPSSVRVFVWHGGSSQKTELGYVLSVGHVALETYLGDVSYYISFWPGNCNTRWCHQNASHFHSKEIDINYEGRTADAIYVLKSLNVEKINTWYETYKNNFFWILSGSSVIKGPDDFNCVGLSYRLLEEGGIRSIIPKQSTQNTKRILAATISSSFAFCTACYWSYHTIRPLWGLISGIETYSMNIIKITEMLIASFQQLKIIDDHIVQGELAIKNIWHFELGAYPKMKTIFGKFIEIITRNNTHSIDFTHTPPEATEMYTFHQRVVRWLTGPSRFLNLGGFAALCTIALGVSIIFFNKKVILETVTPSDLEHLVSLAEREESKILEKMSGSY